MIDYYDRDGNPITMQQCGELRRNRGYARVALHYLPDGSRVSTVWLGLNHNWNPDGAPHIFETMSFPGTSYLEEICQRYSTKEEALAGHREVVERLMDVYRLLKGVEADAQTNAHTNR